MFRLLRLPFTLATLLYQSILLALAQIWANKVRSILTTIGIVIGIASVTAVIAALTGLKANILSEFETFGTNKIFIFPRRPEKGPERAMGWERLRFRPDEFDQFLTYCPSIVKFTRITQLARTVSYGTKSDETVELTGIDPDWHKVENRSVTMGRPFSLVDNTQARPVCLVNPKAQDKLGLDRDCVGQSIMIGQRRFKIIGVVEPRAESAMFGGERAGLEVFIPFSTARQMQPRGGYFVVAASRSPEYSDEARAEALFYLRRKRRIQPTRQDTFGVEAVEKFVQQFKKIATGITMAATGVVGISLLVGGVGIMNIMLVSVSERTREIGLRKAVGARPSAILLQFLVEAVMLCCLGGLIGLAAGQGLTSVIARIPDAKLEKAYIPAWAVILSFGFSASVGLIFGMFPAVKAARLDPIEALRHE